MFYWIMNYFRGFYDITTINLKYIDWLPDRQRNSTFSKWHALIYSIDFDIHVYTYTILVGRCSHSFCCCFANLNIFLFWNFAENAYSVFFLFFFYCTTKIKNKKCLNLLSTMLYITCIGHVGYHLFSNAPTYGEL